MAAKTGKEVTGTVQFGRRSREATIVTLHGQPGRLTLYRDDTIIVDNEVKQATRDDKPIQMIDHDIARMTFTYAAKDGKEKTISGEDIILLVASVFDQIDYMSEGNKLDQLKPPPSPTPSPVAPEPAKSPRA
ncbi:MAG: hypothetical protein H0W34_05830 [Pyrinomonadaceae bacterium]|nr:hypothetical protein [Pyrinomonadaceae bacterium]